MKSLKWTYTNFNSLDTGDLYAIMRLRGAVFVVEQNCPYLDADDNDQEAYHLCGWEDKILVAYARILPPGQVFPEASIGRVVTDPAYRKYGLGRTLMEKAIEKTLAQFSVHEIRIGAQLYLEGFYSSLGFKQTSDQYLEDGIPHIEMILHK